MSDSLSVLLKNYHKAIQGVFGEYLEKIVLYGSYARGDYEQDSDMDIMILANVEPEEVSCYADNVYDVTYDFEMQYGMEINPSVQCIHTYNQWKSVYPFFMNIEKDGVTIWHRSFLGKI